MIFKINNNNNKALQARLFSTLFSIFHSCILFLQYTYNHCILIFLKKKSIYASIYTYVICMYVYKMKCNMNFISSIYNFSSSLFYFLFRIPIVKLNLEIFIIYYFFPLNSVNLNTLMCIYFVEIYIHNPFTTIIIIIR